MKKSTIALIVAAVVCLGLSAFSAKAFVTRTNEAIEEIGEVTYSEDCKAKIDRAVEYYNALDKNLDLQEKVNKEDMKISMLLKLSMHVWQSKLPVLQMQEKYRKDILLMILRNL